MADLERRFVTACREMGIMMTDTCINYQTIMPPLFGEHVAYGDTGVVIYSNSVCGTVQLFGRAAGACRRADRSHALLRAAS